MTGERPECIKIPKFRKETKKSTCVQFIKKKKKSTKYMWTQEKPDDEGKINIKLTW